MIVYVNKNVFNGCNCAQYSVCTCLHTLRLAVNLLTPVKKPCTYSNPVCSCLDQTAILYVFIGTYVQTAPDVTLVCSSRNYHVFYYLLAGSSENERTVFHLKKPEEYHYLNQVRPDTAACTILTISYPIYNRY